MHPQETTSHLSQRTTLCAHALGPCMLPWSPVRPHFGRLLMAMPLGLAVLRHLGTHLDEVVEPNFVGADVLLIGAVRLRVLLRALTMSMTNGRTEFVFSMPQSTLCRNPRCRPSRLIPFQKVDAGLPLHNPGPMSWSSWPGSQK